MSEDERYVGKPNLAELRHLGRRYLSQETSRALLLFLSGKTQAEVAEDNGRTKKVTNDMKVAENLATGRLIHNQSYVLRRGARACRQMMQGRPGINTAKHLMYLWERNCAEAARLGYHMPKVDQRPYER